MEYDSQRAPEGFRWLSTDEGERLSAAMEYHKRTGEKLPNARLHAVIHVVVENQLAEGIEDVTKALTRLLAEGLDRHDAIHAIGSVLSKHIYHIMKGDAQSFDADEPYLRDVRKLNARSWRKQSR